MREPDTSDVAERLAAAPLLREPENIDWPPKLLLEIMFGSYSPTPGVSDLRIWPPRGDAERKLLVTCVVPWPHEYMCE